MKTKYIDKIHAVDYNVHKENIHNGDRKKGVVATNCKVDIKKQAEIKEMTETLALLAKNDALSFMIAKANLSILKDRMLIAMADTRKGTEQPAV